MPQAQPSPRLVRSVCPTDQHVLSNAPKTAKTITRLCKIDPPDPTISSKTLDFRFFCPPQKISRRTIHSPLRLARHAPEQNRTSPNTIPPQNHRESPALTQKDTHRTHT